MDIRKIDEFQFEIDGEAIAATKKAKIVGDTIYLDDKFRCDMVIKLPFSELQINGETPVDIETATRILNTFVGSDSKSDNDSVSPPLIEDVSDTFYLEQPQCFDIINLSAKKIGLFIHLSVELKVKPNVTPGNTYSFLKSSLLKPPMNITSYLALGYGYLVFDSNILYLNNLYGNANWRNYFFLATENVGSFIYIPHHLDLSSDNNNRITINTVLCFNKYWFGEV